MEMTIEERLSNAEYQREQYKRWILSLPQKEEPKLRNLGKETPEQFLERLKRQKEKVKKTLGY